MVWCILYVLYNNKFCIVLETIQQMLMNPSSDSPLEEDIAEQLTKYPKKFEKEARKWTKKYAK